MKYQSEEKDQFTHAYYYDQLNRLTEVFTSEDGIHSSREAHYYYYDYGPLARTEIGDHKVQGQDYAYTINGWMKAQNGSVLNPLTEMGKDASTGYLFANSVEHAAIAKDVTAYTIGYFEGDYAPISGNALELPSAGSAFGNQGLDLFNGNIRHLVTSIVEMGTFGSAYRYDQLNRLKEMQAYQLNGTWANTLATTDYYNNYIYDENGNITDLQRNGTAATNSLLMDQFSYSYGTVGGQLSNRLNYVADTGADDATSIEGDIKSGQTSNNYQYDALGQLTRDVQEGISSIVWRKGDKKIKAMTQNDNSPDLEFYYNPFGVRIAKLEKTKTGGVLNSEDQWKWTYYSYDANGQCMAVYEILKSSEYNKASLAEQHIYGSSRLGMVQNYKLLYNNGSPLPAEPINKQDELGKRRYELTNHLGNVQALITDRKIWNATDTLYEAVVMMTSDFYPFGMAMPGRQNVNISNSEDYRYAYNGMEQDNEVSGNGNSYTTEFRQYDPRLGRWKSLDPLMAKYPMMSPYVAFNNNPTFFIDPNGLEGEKGNNRIKDRIVRGWRRLTNQNVRDAFKYQKENGGDIDVWKGNDGKIRASVEGTLSNQGSRATTNENGDIEMAEITRYAKIFNPKERKSRWAPLAGYNHRTYTAFTASMASTIFPEGSTAEKLVLHYGNGTGKPYELSDDQIKEIFPNRSMDNKSNVDLKLSPYDMQYTGEYNLEQVPVYANASGTLGRFYISIKGERKVEQITTSSGLTTSTNAINVFRGVVSLSDVYDFNADDGRPGNEESGGAEFQTWFGRNFIGGTSFQISGEIEVMQIGNGPLTDLNGIPLHGRPKTGYGW